MKCRTVRERIMDQLDTVPARPMPLELERHLESCPDCARYFDEARRTVAALTPQQAVRPTLDFKERVMNQILSLDKPIRPMDVREKRQAWYWKPAVVGGLAVLLVFLFLAADLLIPTPDGNHSAAPALLMQAWAKEQALFESPGIVHLVNQVLVPPLADETLSRGRWFPLMVLDADGKTHLQQLSLASEPGKGYTVTDEVWYDPAQGFYARILKRGEEIIFATAFDGSFVYQTGTREDGENGLMKNAISGDFQPPSDVVSFLGIYPGFQSQIDPAQVQQIESAQLEDGTEVDVFQSRMTTLEENAKNAMLFRVKKTDQTLAEIEWRIGDTPVLIVRRLKTETVDQEGITWNLADIDRSNPSNEQHTGPTVNADMVRMNVSVNDMLERATFETYLFSAMPAWTQSRVICDILDLPSPPNRMFMIVYPATDGRHVVMVQSLTFNKSMGPMAKQGKMIYQSVNGFKVWSSAQDKMGAEILLRSAQAILGTMPSDDRSGYILESPSGTFPALAVNGSLTDEELHGLVDHLIPAKDWKE